MTTKDETATHSISLQILAPAERIWEVVSDVTNMGNWSPICRRCEWTQGAGPVTGARFVGHNRLWGWRWSRECVVTESEPGRTFAFSTLLHGRESVRWRYEFAPADGGTHVTESYEIITEPRYLKLMPHVRRAFRRAAQRGMIATLERVKTATEKP